MQKVLIFLVMMLEVLVAQDVCFFAGEDFWKSFRQFEKDSISSLLGDLSKEDAAKYQELVAKYQASGGIYPSARIQSLQGCVAVKGAMSIFLTGDFTGGWAERLLKSFGGVQMKKDGEWEIFGNQVQITAEKFSIHRQGGVDSSVFRASKKSRLFLEIKSKALESIAQKNRKLEALPQMLGGISVDLGEGSLEIGATFLDAQQAAMVHGLYSGMMGMIMVQMDGILSDMEKQIQNKELEFGIVEKWLNIRWLRVILSDASAEKMNDRIVFRFSTSRFQSGGFEVFGKLIGAIGSISEKIKDRGGFQFGDMMGAPVLGNQGCEQSIRMAEQAVHFYNLDHLQKKTWSQIREELFTEGYLPPDLECNGILIKDTDPFLAGGDGKLKQKQKHEH